MADNNPMKSVLSWITGIGSVALILLIFAILFGNLSGNVGFASGTAGYNNTQNIITNSTSSFQNTAAQFPVVGTIVGVAVLLLILLAVAVWAIRKFQGMNSGGSQTFG